MFAIVALSFIACNNNKPDQDKSIMPEKSSLTSVDTLGTQVNNAASLSQDNAPNTTATGALNPEHGMPGHRCEIAVGAPLSSAPAITTGNAQPTINTTAPATTIPALSGSGKLNPAHGQPGHDCAIAVGQPLNK